MSGYKTIPRHKLKSKYDVPEITPAIVAKGGENLSFLQEQVKVGDVYHEAAALEETSKRKEEILTRVNQSIVRMSSQTFAPPMRHFKYLVMRAALAQMFDCLALLEWRLRGQLGLQNDPRYQKLSVFPQVFRRHLGKHRGAPRKDTKKGLDTRKGSLKDSPSRIESVGAESEQDDYYDDEEDLGDEEKIEDWAEEDQEEKVEETLDEVVLEPIDWTSPEAVMYKGKLSAMVYELLASSLEALLPVITYDGYRLNPLLPPPEI